MRQAIVTKYLGPTNHRGSRIKATAEAGSMTVCWNYELNTEENHRAAAQAFAKRLNWGSSWTGGALPKQAGYCWVQRPVQLVDLQREMNAATDVASTLAALDRMTS